MLFSDDLNFYGLYISISNSKERNEKRVGRISNEKKAKSSFQLLKKDLRAFKRTNLLSKDEENQSVVRWAPNGIGFIVINEDTFSREILPKYFKHSNYSSFVRQVNFDLT